MSTTTFNDTHPTARAERRSDERERPKSDSPSDHGFIVTIVASVFAVVVTVAIIAPPGWAALAVAFGVMVTTTKGSVHLMLTMMDDEGEANDKAANSYG
jgi:hypothetical protein